MTDEFKISEEKLDSFVSLLDTGVEGIEQQYLTDFVDYDTTIPAKTALIDAFNKRNAVVYKLTAVVETEKTNITNLKDVVVDADKTMAGAYESEGN